MRISKNLFLLLFTAGFLSCGSGQRPILIHSSKELSKVSEMAYFPPVFHFASDKKAELPTPKKYIFQTAEAVDSILNSTKEYRIATRMDEATTPAVNKIFEQLKKGNTNALIPPELQAQLKNQSHRFILGLQFEPNFVLWRSTERTPYFKPRDGLIFRSSRLNLFILDTDSFKVIYYGRTSAKNVSHPTWNAKESIDNLYRKIFPDFNNG